MAKTNKGRKLFATTATAALVASAIVPVASAAQVNDFNSVSSYAQEAVQDLVDRGVITGDEKGNFNPKKTVTRAEAAKILTEALGLEASGSISFSDVKAGAWYYDAIAAAVSNKVFEGQGAGKFNPTGNLTRSEAAKILVEAFGLEGTASLSSFKDAGSVKAWAKESLEIAVANGVLQGDNGNLKPNDAITKQDFAVMFSRTEKLDAAPEVTGSVKAINNTTVEVTFDKAVTDLASLEFKIEGLDITSKVVKQTDSKTVVLTTAAQTAGTTYAVTVNGDKVGSFTGVAEVIPTAVTFESYVEASKQGVIGEQVTVKANVTVAEGQSKANIPVTFNILNSNSANDKVEVQVLTNADGVATYSYTRYYASEDTVTAYATKKSSVFDQAKVYWANKAQLTVTDVTEAKELANEAKKSYKVTGSANTTYYVAIKENIGVTADKITKVKVQSADGTVVTPYQTATGLEYATVKTDSNGEASFTVYGSNLTATPIVYAPQSTPTTPVTYNYTKLDLQAVASTVTFKQIDTLKVEVAAEGTEKAARYSQTPVTAQDNSVGGRLYTVTVTDKDGKVAPEGSLAYVTFEDGNFNGDIYVTSGSNNFVKVIADDVYRLVVGKNGKVQFRVAGSGTNAYVKPTVFLNTAGKVETTETSTNFTLTTAELDKGDVQVEAAITYFQTAVVANATLTVTDSLGREITTSLPTNQDAYFRYQSVDQNGFAYRPNASVISGSYVVYVPETINGVTGYRAITVDNTNSIPSTFNLSFDVTSSTGQVKVYQGNSAVELQGTQNTSRTKTYSITSDLDGSAVIRVDADLTTKVDVNVTGSNLPSKSASVQFTNATVLPSLHQGLVTEYNTLTGTIKFDGYNAVSIKDAGTVYKQNGIVLPNGYSDFINVLTLAKDNAQGVVVKRTVAADGVVTLDIVAVASGSGYTAIQDVTPVSSTALQTAINNLNAAVTPVKAADYITTDQAAVQTAINAANAVLFGGSTNPQDYITALATFNTAMTGKTTQASVDAAALATAKSALQAAIDAVIVTDYVTADQADVTTAKATAQAAHDATTATVTTVNAAKDALAAALVGKTKKSTLTAAEVAGLAITASAALNGSDTDVTLTVPTGTTAVLDGSTVAVTGTATTATTSVAGLVIKLANTPVADAQGSIIKVTAKLSQTDKLDTNVELTLTYDSTASAWTVAKVVQP